MNVSHDKISEWSETLTKRLLEIRFFDAEEIKTILSIHLAMGMKNCLEVQTSETLRKLNQIKIKIQNCGGVNQNKLQAELTILKQKHCEEARALTQVTAIVRKDEKYNIMCMIVANRFGDDIYEEIKAELKLKMDGFKVNKNGEHLPESGFKRGRRELIDELKKEFENKGMIDGVDILENYTI